METDQKEGAAEAGKEGEEAEAAKPKVPEALSHTLDNPSRVTPAQQKFVAYDEASRWRPIHGSRPVTGIIIFKDLQPGVHNTVLTWHKLNQWHAEFCMRQSPGSLLAALQLSLCAAVPVVPGTGSVSILVTADRPSESHHMLHQTEHTLAS